MLAAFIDQEVFMVAPGSTVENEDVLAVFRTIDDCNQFLATVTPEEAEDYRVLHGYLTEAMVIPKSFDGTFPYIIVENPLDPGSGFVVESDVDIPIELVQQMEKVIEEAESDVERKEIDREYNIDDFYILYGYELIMQTDPTNLRFMCVSELDVNQIQLDSAERITNEVVRIKRKHKTLLANTF